MLLDMLFQLQAAQASLNLRCPSAAPGANRIKILTEIFENNSSANAIACQLLGVDIPLVDGDVDKEGWVTLFMQIHDDEGEAALDRALGLVESSADVVLTTEESSQIVQIYESMDTDEDNKSKGRVFSKGLVDTQEAGFALRNSMNDPAVQALNTFLHEHSEEATMGRNEDGSAAGMIITKDIFKEGLMALKLKVGVAAFNQILGQIQAALTSSIEEIEAEMHTSWLPDEYHPEVSANWREP